MLFMNKNINKRALDTLRQTRGSAVVIYYGTWEDREWWPEPIVKRFKKPGRTLVILYPAKDRCIIEQDGRTIFHGTQYQATEYGQDKGYAKKTRLSHYYMEELAEREPVRVRYADKDDALRDVTDELAGP